jgi:D-glutamate N-acetyltransferase
VPRRRYVILAEGQFGQLGSKTAMGVIRYGRDSVVAVLDSSQAGRNVRDWMGEAYDIPVVASLAEAMAHRPSALLIGIAPQGGKIPAAWRSTIHAAIDAGLDVVSGLHEFIGDDPEFRAAAAVHGVELIDHRRPPDRNEVSTGRAHLPGKHVILTVGTDCAIGKMSVALELRKSALDAGLRAVFVATGQTGIMIEGWGVAVDRVISDFVQGTVEWLVEQAEEQGDWIFVEGQGSLDHPAYSSVTLGLIHGATPQGLVLVHEPTRSEHHGWEGRQGAALKDLPAFIALHEQVAALVAPSRVVAIALNTTRMAEPAARAEIARVAAETGLPADDPVRFGAERLLDGIRARLAGP